MAESDDNLGVSEQSSGGKGHHRENSEGTIIKEAEPTGKRSYECVYCKRGFTNAQALGGHMNIHRKDRANKSFSSSPSPSKNVPFGNRPSLEALWSKLSSHSSTSCASLLNPNNHLHSYMQVAISSGSSSMSGDQDEAMGSNLSLHIGSSNYVEIADEKGQDRMDDIDLELRLGRRDP